MDAIFTFINQRFDNRADESLADLAEEVPLHARSLVSQAAWVYDHRGSLLRFLSEPGQVDDLVSFTLGRLKAFVYTRNPYLDLGTAARDRLRALYDRYYRAISALVAAAPSRASFVASLSDLTTENLALVGQVLQGQAGFYGGSADAEAAYYTTLVAGEYAPGTQLTRLGIDIAGLREPVLDLGCGSHAALTTILRDAGVDSVGIDRNAPDLSFCRRVGWEDFDFGSDVWGTVLSHQAFSTHFLFHHRHSERQSLAMARTMMSILRGLQPGGRFVYTPGLPFIEPLLVETGLYQVTTRPLPDLPDGLEAIAYATHILRL